MIVDSRDLADGQLLEADLCIIGAGAAGISVALEFAGTDVDVLLLEAGGRTSEVDTQALYAGFVEDARLHSPPDRYRQRRFGGTTTIWGGRCMPFDPIDFEVRDYVPHSGWPIGREAMDPYYPKANRLCEAGSFAYTAEDALPGGSRPIIDGFEGSHFTTNRLERFSCPTDFGSRYGDRLEAASNIRVVLHANVTALNLAPSGALVDTVTVQNLQGRRLKVRARQVVLATGGLEVPRLLLASRSVQPNGIGNTHDVVGRYYMCHIAGTIGSLKIARPTSAVWHGYEVSAEGVYCRRRFALRETTQRQRGLGNFIARLHHPRITDPRHRNGILSLLFLSQAFIPYEYRMRLTGSGPRGLKNWLQHALNVTTGSVDAAQFAWHMLRDRKMAERKFPSIIIKSKANLFSIDFHAEQEPNRSSRVALTEDLDSLGLPRLKVDWRYTAGDLKTVTSALALLADDFQRANVGTLEYDADSVEAEMTRYGAYGGHHIGTARMGSDPRSSVVDADCRVHGVSNLFIASAATFATSSQANPTLTVVALSLRIAAHLKALLNRPHRTTEARTSVSEPTANLL